MHTNRSGWANNLHAHGRVSSRGVLITSKFQAASMSIWKDHNNLHQAPQSEEEHGALTLIRHYRRNAGLLFLHNLQAVTSKSDKMARVKPSKSVTYKSDQPVAKKISKTHRNGNNEIKKNLFKNEKEDSDTVIITAGDISRIKITSVILTPAELARKRKEQQEEHMKTSAIAYQRKAMMLKMEAERKKKTGALTETEKLKKEEDAKILDNANRKREEILDDVKKMESMMMYARCVTIRDQQKIEKAQKMKELEEENRQLDSMMMMKTQKEGEEHDKREQLRAEQRRQGAITLKKQIEEAEARRKIEEELKEQEAKRLLENIEKAKEEEYRKMLEKQEIGQRQLEDIEKYNQQQKERKLRLAQQEKEEQERINLYHRNKELLEQEKQEEQERLKKMKEMETARLRAIQEKAQDRQAQLDELRAQRTHEAIQREWREKEKAEAEKAMKLNQEMAKAREEQMMFRVKELADQARREQAEYFRVIREQEAEVMAAKVAEEEECHRNLQLKEEILEQIKMKKEKMQMERKEKFDEGERQKADLKAEYQVLESIKARKLKELVKEGIPPKYTYQLFKKKVLVS
eukprot:Gb_08916 [translate_table: standard]